MKLSTRTIFDLGVAVIFGIALFIRLYFPYHNVFADGWVRFHENDPWYHMRLIENLVHHFPHLLSFDPYGFYPYGQLRDTAPFLDLFLGFFVWVIGLGHPSRQVIETVGAYSPAVLGSLITIPIYFIGREVFNRKAGLIAAALIAILPGQFLWRTLVGFVDYHVTEIFFSALALMFMMFALKSSKQKKLSFNSLWERDWRSMRRTFLFSLLAGISLGCYLLSWTGGALFVFIIFAFAVVQYIMDHLRGRSTDYLCIVGFPTFLIALLMVVPVLGQYMYSNLQVASLVISIVTIVILSAVSILMTKINIKLFYYPLVLAVLGGIGLAIFYVVDSPLLDAILSRLSVFTPEGGYLTIAEVKGLALSSNWQKFFICFYLILICIVVIAHSVIKEKAVDRILLLVWCAIIVGATLIIGWENGLSLSTVWDQYTICFFLSLISIVLIAYLIAKEGAADRTLLFIWSLIMLIAVFGQNRFAYYFAVNVALLTAYLSWKILELGGFKEVTEEAKQEEGDKQRKQAKDMEKVKLSKKARRKREKARREQHRTPAKGYGGASLAYGIVAIVVVFFLVFYPNIGMAIDRAKAPPGASYDWHESLTWMRDNTPDPFQNTDFYYELYQKPAAGETYDYPESAYGVMSWWDYGDWITYMAHRIPNANPVGQKGARDAGSFFTAQNETSANAVLDRLGSKYVIIDNLMAIPQIKFHAMVTWADKSTSQFYEVYYMENQNGDLAPVMRYCPEYYQSMCVRLYFFEGKEWVPQETVVISWSVRELTSVDGDRFKAKVVTDRKSFSSYNDAKEFVEAHTGYKIVGETPFISPVPLEKLEHYKTVHKSPNTVSSPREDKTSYVEIFEYSP